MFDFNEKIKEGITKWSSVDLGLDRFKVYLDQLEDTFDRGFVLGSKCEEYVVDVYMKPFHICFVSGHRVLIDELELPGLLEAIIEDIEDMLKLDKSKNDKEYDF